MRYRAMIAEDYDAAGRLWENTAGMGLSSADSREGILQFLGRNPGLSQVCEAEDGTLAGTVLCGHDGRRGYMYHVAVSAACRGKGAGREMVSRALSALRDAGIAKCHLMVIEGNGLGRSFWSGTGWEERDGIVLFSQNT
ncbi:GNAT family N-acetyltransferase [Paenibacillus sp. FSL R7-0331]|uniref:GNAT family N-acetyltransferase n=1 Tax=Paenibacillus sp. FSL R7-0331 TaxID=1536773 RepID=UPI0004F6A099|nr:GNAT family N-acetyltransferase [Paenibacillus sp. FSL R7-0331]AIQ50418.1 GCN5 family acetyltransferase [Paenibacillus sp. FSL R7-0331]